MRILRGSALASGRVGRRSAYIFLAFLVDDLLVFEQQLHSFDEFGVDGVQKSVLGLDAHHDQQFDHFQIFDLDGQIEGASTQRVDAVDVDRLESIRFVDHPARARTSATIRKKKDENKMERNYEFTIIGARP